MKKTISVLSLLLCVCMLIPCIPSASASAASAVAEDEAKLAAVPGEDSESLRSYATKLAYEQELNTASYTASGYTTYTLSDCTFKWTVPNTTEGGTTCSAMQGMNTGTTYCYAAKRNSSDTYCDVTRINMDTGAKTVMDYYASTSATSTSAMNCLGHANDLTVVGINSVNYMYVATLWSVKAITRLQISGTKLMFTGYFDLVTAAGTSVTASAIKHIKTVDGYLYFLVKRGNSFYTCKIAENATGGSASSPTKVTIYKIFVIDTRNAVFASSSSSYSTMSGIDTWTNQGFGYNKTEKVLYVPIWDSSTATKNVIITYNLSDVIDTWLVATANQSKTVFPTKTSFMIQDTSVSQFEIESAGFRTGQGTTGDLNLYFNVNCSSSAKEGVFKCSYTTGSGDFTPVSDGKAVYTVKYNANGGTGSTDSTNHIYGLSVKLRTNAFTRSGYTFAGWYLYRKSDKKWLYRTASGSAVWYAKGSQPEGAVLALYSDGQSVSKLTTVDGDTVTCYAQWTPTSTGTTTFYIQYDANGGTGTMNDTTVVYGTSTNLSANTFTRDGYVFTGWTAYRRTNAQWAYKDKTALTDKWLTVSDDKTGYFLKTYCDCSAVAKTTSTDRDIVTLYAVWSRVANGVYPSSLTAGSAFTLGGTVQTTTHMKEVSIRVKDSAGTVVASHSASPYASTYDISAANSDIDFSALGVGNYTYEVVIQTYNGSTPTNTTLLSTAFAVVDPATLALTDEAAASGLYTLGDVYFRGFGENITVSELSALFKYAVTVTDANGNALGAADTVGTGCIISCAGESRTAVLVFDMNGDASVTTADMLLLSSTITLSCTPNDAAREAGDGDADAAITTTDLLALKRRLAG